MSAHDLDKENFYITQEAAPNTYRIYMAFPIELSEYWAYLFEDNGNDQNIKCSVEPMLAVTLLKEIRSALIKDNAAVEDSSSPLGVKPLKGEIRDDKLSKIEQIDLAVAKAAYISRLGRLYGTDNISGCQIVTNSIPLDVAKKAQGLNQEGANMMLGAKMVAGDDGSCRVRMATLMHIAKMEN